MYTTSGTYAWSFVTQIFHNGQPSHAGYRKIFEVMTSSLPRAIGNKIKIKPGVTKRVVISTLTILFD